MKCKNCGADIPDNALQCEVCGAPAGAEMSDFNDETKIIDQEELRAAAAAGAGAEAAEEIFDENEKKRQEQVQKMLEDKKKQLSEIERRRNEKRKRQKRKKALIIALICALAVGGAGVGAYYIAQGLNGADTVKATLAPAATESAVSPSPAASPDASPASSPDVSPSVAVSAAPKTETAAQANSNGQSWSQAGNGNTSSTGGASNGNTSSNSGSASNNNTSNSSQRTASNTGSQKSASNSASAGSSSSSGSGGASSSSGSSGGSSSGGSSASASAQSAADSGLVSDPIASKQVTGGEVIYNEGTGRYLMTFIMDGKRYYANVSEGSTTDQIQNKSFTIDADATQESYGGNTVYEISSMTNTSGSYILENSSAKLLTESDMAGMSKYDLALARNEIFARHGRKFQTPEYNRYFSSKSWYKINPNYNYSDDNANLNSVERQNVQFILNAEKNK